MTNSTNNISADISMNDQKLEEVSRFKYLEVTLCKAAVCAFVMFTNCEGQSHKTVSENQIFV